LESSLENSEMFHLSAGVGVGQDTASSSQSYATEHELVELAQVFLNAENSSPDIKRVYAAFHEKKAEARSLQLRLNHSELQVP
jgi:hypothetical protein